jgi:hypothetical protein
VVEDAKVRCLAQEVKEEQARTTNGSTTRTTAGMVDVIVLPNPVINDEDEDNGSKATNISPLTLTTTTTLSSEESLTTHASSTAGGRGRMNKNKRSRLSPRQASEARLKNKEARDSLNQRYSEAFKEATTILMSSKRKDTKQTADQILQHLNETHDLIGTAKTLSRSTVYRAAANGLIGKSPMKKGPPAKIPSALLEVVAVHAEVCQVGNQGELRGREIQRLIGASVLGTKFENKFKVQSVWKKVRREFPEKLQAGVKVSVDDARAQWTTQNNLQQWFDDAKRDLIETGLVLNREVRDSVTGNLISELDFRSDEVRRRIINMDETHHDLSVTGDQGGPRSVIYYNPNLQRGCKRGVKASRHVTGVYATNAAGEALPPMYIFDSCAKIDENFRVKLQWLDGLPTIIGRFGCPTRIESSSFYSVRSRGSMDDSLLNDYIDKVLLPLYPNISKHTSFDLVTGKFAPYFKSRTT